MDKTSGRTLHTAELVGTASREGYMHWAKIHGKPVFHLQVLLCFLELDFCGFSFTGLSLDIFQWHRKRKAEVHAKILNQKPNVDHWQSFLEGTKVCKVKGHVWEKNKSAPGLKGTWGRMGG